MSAEHSSLLPLTGVLYSADRKTSHTDPGLYGFVRVGGVTYRVEVSGPQQSHRGTARRRHTMQLTPLEESTRPNVATSASAEPLSSSPQQR